MNLCSAIPKLRLVAKLVSLVATKPEATWTFLHYIAAKLEFWILSYSAQ